jgi:hypothetical protein
MSINFLSRTGALDEDHPNIPRYLFTPSNSDRNSVAMAVFIMKFTIKSGDLMEILVVAFIIGFISLILHAINASKDLKNIRNDLSELKKQNNHIRHMLEQMINKNE